MPLFDRRFFVRGAALALGGSVVGRTKALEPGGSLEHSVTDFGARPDQQEPQTAAIQSAIDALSRRGGGTLRFPPGVFVTGALELQSNIRLVFERESILKGSDDWRDYGEGRWLDALITARDARNIRIEGPGLIDGADCTNPKGEEGFRGPHGIVFLGCRDVVIANLQIARTGNYGLYCRDCAEFELRNLKVRGGHDAVHAQACAKFNIRDCDFRTGDDCLAGCDNRDFEVVGCQINSSCNGFRLGCVNLAVEKCRFWGPGEYPHLISVRRGAPRTNMLAAFVHFAPKDRSPKLPSDHWLVQDCTIDKVDQVYGYDYQRGLWQTGQPAKRLRFVNLKASGIVKPLRVRGDADRQFELAFDQVEIALREDRADQPVIDATQFGALVFQDVVLQNSGKSPVIVARDGGKLCLDRVRSIPKSETPYVFERIEEVRIDRPAD